MVDSRRTKPAISLNHQSYCEPFIHQRIFSPGPTPVANGAKFAAFDSEIYHRSDDFYELHLKCARQLQSVFGSEELPVILTCSGTGGLEAALVNLTDPGDEVIVVNGGKFGERWEKLATQYECKAHVLRINPGSAATCDRLEPLLDAVQSPKAFFIQANETSTGVQHPVRDLTRMIKSRYPHCLIVVDAISYLVAHPLHMISDGFDCVISASQKGFGLNPGLAFIALSKRARAAFSVRPKFYFDLEREISGQSKGRSAWTPAIGLVQGLSYVLDRIESVGLSTMVANHGHLASAVRSALPAMGLELFPESHPSDALTAIKVPVGIDGVQLQKRLKDAYGVVIPGGQDELKGRIVRLSNLGFVNRFDLLHGLAAIEFSLQDLGYTGARVGPVGAGVQAFMETITRTDPLPSSV